MTNSLSPYKKIAIVLLAILITSPALGEDPQLSTPVCWPLSFAGITLGVNTDSEVQRLLGNGVVRKNAVTLAERYYVDSNKTATLRILSQTDYLVAEVTVQEGVTVKPEEINVAISPWFNPLQGFGNLHALHLGSTKEEVKSNLGEPVKRSTVDSWRYDSGCSCEIQNYLTIYFKSNRIFKIVFSTPHG